MSQMEEPGKVGGTDEVLAGASEVGGVVGAGEMGGDDSGRSEAESMSAPTEEDEKGDGVVGAAEVGGLAD